MQDTNQHKSIERTETRRRARISAFLALGICLLVFHAERVEGRFRAFGAIVEYPEKSLPHPPVVSFKILYRYHPRTHTPKIFYPTPHPIFQRVVYPEKYITLTEG
jgi:hypothetical protein